MSAYDPKWTSTADALSFGGVGPWSNSNEEMITCASGIRLALGFMQLIATLSDTTNSAPILELQNSKLVILITA
jgi:hypothetical protein